MNKQFVKNVYEKTPRGIKKLFSRTIRNLLINNKVFKKQYDLLVRAEQMTSSEVDTIQQQELKKICIYAYENCDFYKNEFDKNGFNPYDFTVDDFICKVPIIDKDIVLNNIEGINSPVIDDSYEAVTGGSSGKRLVVNTTMECLYKEYAFVYHHYTKFTKPYDYKRSSLAYIGGYGDTLISENPLYAMRIYNSMARKLAAARKSEHVFEGLERLADGDRLGRHAQVLRQFQRVVAGMAAGIRPGQQHAVHMVGPESIDAHDGHDAGVDAPGKPHERLQEARAFRVFLQRLHTEAVPVFRLHTRACPTNSTEWRGCARRAIRPRLPPRRPWWRRWGRWARAGSAGARPLRTRRGRSRTRASCPPC